MFQTLVTQMKSTLLKLKFRLVLKKFFLSPGTTYILGESLHVKGEKRNALGYSNKSYNFCEALRNSGERAGLGVGNLVLVLLLSNCVTLSKSHFSGPDSS